MSCIVGFHPELFVVVNNIICRNARNLEIFCFSSFDKFRLWFSYCTNIWRHELHVLPFWFKQSTLEQNYKYLVQDIKLFIYLILYFCGCFWTSENNWLRQLFWLLHLCVSLLLLLKRKVFTTSFFWYVPSPWNWSRIHEGHSKQLIRIFT